MTNTETTTPTKIQPCIYVLCGDCAMDCRRTSVGQSVLASYSLVTAFRPTQPVNCCERCAKSRGWL